MESILIIEDETALADRLVKILSLEGYDAVCVGDGKAGIKRALRTQFSLIITDLMVPGLTGVEIVSILRSREQTKLTPVIVITCLSDRSDHRSLMELGADDYITKPFTIDELLKSVRTQLQKRQWREESLGWRKSGAVFCFAQWTFDVDRDLLTDGRGVERVLTPQESRLLQLFLNRPGEVLSRDELFHGMGLVPQSPFDRRIDVIVGRLRRKIEAGPTGTNIIETVRYKGYALGKNISIQAVERK